MHRSSRRTILGMATALLAVRAGAAFSAPTAPPVEGTQEARPMKDIRFVIFHAPGPRWQAGKGMFDQEGLQAHLDHYRKLHADGKLVLGGPHLDDQGGGMMIPEAGLTREELTAFAEADPAVASGLLRVQVRPWLVGMKK